MNVTRWYSSKVDWWLAILLAVAPLVTIGAVIGAVAAGTGLTAALLGVAFLAAIYVGLVLPMKYGMDDEHLVIRHGLVRQRIALQDIVEVFPSRNPLSSPALSLDRLEIRYGDDYPRSAMVSPAARSEFLSELARRAQLRQDGDRLVRSG
jgi:hypothetical protein